MTEPHNIWHPRRYQFRIGGPVSDSARQVFAGMSIEEDGAQTLVTAGLPDRPSVYAIVEQIQRLGLVLLGIRPFLRDIGSGC